MKKIIAIANQKGGVAKQQRPALSSRGLKQKGYKVLTIDLDPQGNLTDSVGADGVQFTTSYELYEKGIEAEEAIQLLEAFDIIPANILLAGAEQEFFTDWERASV
jgi:chromosome partitioning protein